MRPRCKKCGLRYNRNEWAHSLTQVSCVYDVECSVETLEARVDVMDLEACSGGT